MAHSMRSRHSDWIAIVTLAAFTLMVLSAVAADPATVRPLEGESVKGRVAQLSATTVVVETSDWTSRPARLADHVGRMADFGAVG